MKITNRQALTVRCPACCAMIGTLCLKADRKREYPINYVHPARRALYAETLKRELRNA
jgi:hypothetical protein